MNILPKPWSSIYQGQQMLKALNHLPRHSAMNVDFDLQISNTRAQLQMTPL